MQQQLLGQTLSLKTVKLPVEVKKSVNKIFMKKASFFFAISGTVTDFFPDVF